MVTIKPVYLLGYRSVRINVVVLDRTVYINSRKKLFPSLINLRMYVLDRMPVYNCFTNKKKDNSICYYIRPVVNFVQKVTIAR